MWAKRKLACDFLDLDDLLAALRLVSDDLGVSDSLGTGASVGASGAVAVLVEALSFSDDNLWGWAALDDFSLTGRLSESWSGEESVGAGFDDLSELISKLAFFRACAPWAWREGRVLAWIASFGILGESHRALNSGPLGADWCSDDRNSLLEGLGLARKLSLGEDAVHLVISCAVVVVRDVVKASLRVEIVKMIKLELKTASDVLLLGNLAGADWWKNRLSETRAWEHLVVVPVSWGVSIVGHAFSVWSPSSWHIASLLLDLRKTSANVADDSSLLASGRIAGRPLADGVSWNFSWSAGNVPALFWVALVDWLVDVLGSWAKWVSGNVHAGTFDGGVVWWHDNF